PARRRRFGPRPAPELRQAGRRADAMSPTAGVRSWAGLAPSVIWVMWKREVTRYLRDRSQLFGGLSRTILWLVVLGFGIGAALREIEGYSYAQYKIGRASCREGGCVAAIG